MLDLAAERGASPGARELIRTTFWFGGAGVRTVQRFGQKRAFPLCKFMQNGAVQIQPGTRIASASGDFLFPHSLIHKRKLVKILHLNYSNGD